MRVLRAIGLIGLVLVLGVLIQAVLLVPVEGDPDRGMLPPIDQPVPSGAR